MSPGPTHAAPAVKQAEDELARLQEQVQAMRALLVQQMQDVVLAESQLARTDAGKIADVNEKLVVAALSSQDDADTATMALEDAQTSAALDALTGLPNRTTLSSRLAQAIANARRHGTGLALLFIDLDGFKQLNDSGGHAFGDKILCLMAERMRAAVREVDTVSRHGGDEFLVLLGELTAPRDAMAVARKLNAAISGPARVDGQQIQVTASIGIALYPDDGSDERSLVRAADGAMYASKRRATGGIAFHDADRAAMPAVALANGAADLTAADLARQQQLLRQANEQLVLAALSAQELKAAAEASRQRQAAFIAAVADELRNPLAPIRIIASMLGRRDVDVVLVPRLQGLVDRQLEQLSRVVGQLVDGADGACNGRGADPPALEQVALDLGRLVDECVIAYRLPLSRQRQRLELQRPATALPVLGDPYRLVQVVGNLLDNASRHSPDGGVVSLTVQDSASTVTMTVADHGSGIAAHLLPHIFDPFVQDEPTLDTRSIGLSVVRAIVRAHGGDLVAHSAGIERGSQFVVTLPRLHAADLTAAAPRAP